MDAKDAITWARGGHVDFFKTVDLEILLKARDERDKTVLTVAAMEGHLDCCEVIVERCPQLLYYQQTYAKSSVLHYVAAYDERDKNVENIMRFLITADSKPDLERGGGGAKLPNHSLLTMQDIEGGTALHRAVERSGHRATKLLLEADLDFELLRMVDNKGRTCLHIAVEKGDYEAAELIIKTRPGMEFLKMTKGRLNQTALHVAAKKGNLEMVELIWEADPDKQLLSMPDSQGNTPLHLALRDRKVEIVRLLTEGEDMEAQRDAIRRAKSSNVDFFKTVDLEILLKARDERDKTVLTVAAMEGHLDCCEVIVERCPQLLYLQESGTQWSVLHRVAAFNRDNNVENIMRFLLFTADSQPDLERGGGAKLPNHSLLRMQTTSRFTALHLAVILRNHGTTKLLLEADRDFELLRMVNDDGATCLHIAVEKGDHVSAGLIITKSRPDIEFLKTREIKLNQTALHVAVKEGYLEMVKLICDADPDKQLLSMPDSQGNTPLHLALRHRKVEMVRLCDMVTVYCSVNNVNQTPLSMAMDKAARARPGSDAQVICKLLLENDCTKVVDFHGQNVLHVAAHHGHLAVVQHFLESKDTDVVALLNRQDKDGNMPLHLAASKGNVEVVRLLLKAPQISAHIANISQQTTYTMAMAKNLSDESGECSKSDMELGGGVKMPNKRLLTMQNTYGNTALHLAVTKRNHEVTKLLLEADPDFELLRMVNNCGETCLHIAAYESDHVSAGLIIKARPDNEFLKMTESKSNQTALHIAVEKKSLAIVQFLLEADHSNDLLAVVDSHHQRTALHYAVEQGNLDMVKLICKAALDKQLLSMPDSRGNTPLHLAVRNSNLEIVTLLIEGDIVTVYCAVNYDNQTPLIMAMDKASQDGSGPVSQVICKLLLEKDPSQCTKQMGDKRWTLLHYAISYGLHSVAVDIIQLCPDCIKAEDFDSRTPYMTATRRILSNECRESTISDSKIIRMLLEKDPKQCTKLEDGHGQPFIHVAVKLELNDVVETILESKKIDATILNIQDNDGNTPLHIAALGKNERMTLCLLYDARVNKEIENTKKEKAIDLINFPYDEAKARVYSLGHQSDLKDQRSFDLLVAALIATVSFTAGITVPGGYVSDGANKGSAILLKATIFKVFVVSNNFALLFSLYTVFLNFSTRCLLKEEDVYYESKMGTFRTRLLLKKKDMIYQLNVATLCTLSAIYAMVVAFITGSYAVLANSDGLAITVCVSSCFFLILASHATWTMAMQYWHSKPLHGVSS